MSRSLVVVAAILLLLAPRPAWADAFDRYINPILAKAPSMEGVQEIKQLTPVMIVDNDRVLPRMNGALVIVQTNEGRFGKLLVHAARRNIKGAKPISMLQIDRFVTYQGDEERAVQAKGENIDLFPGFQLNLDIGQIVPPALGGDLQYVSEGGKSYAQPLGTARLYLVTKALPGTAPTKNAPPTAGEVFEPRLFNGTYKLHDDGRRSGTLTLKVSEDGSNVTGSFYSDKDGKKYEVSGKLGTPKSAIQFTVKFPRVEETFQGWLFTGDARALAGSSHMQEREAGFYAVRTEEE